MYLISQNCGSLSYPLFAKLTERLTKGEVVTLIILLTQYFDKFSGFALK